MEQKTICLRGVNFQKITEQTFDKINLSELKFFFISRSGIIDTPGKIYFFTSDGAFIMYTNAYGTHFIEERLSFIYDQEWNIINLCFCDFLFINPKIYKSFVTELCSRNIRDFWFETTIDIYKDRAWE